MNVPASPSRRARRPQRRTPVSGDDRSSALYSASPWHELVRVHGLMRRHAEPHFARLGLSGAQWGVLRSLSRLRERGVQQPRMHELADELLVHPPSLSVTLERMDRAGLITRRVDPADHRSRLIGLTSAGRRVLTQATDEHRAWIDRMIGVLTPSERDQLGTLLMRLGGHLSELLDQPNSVTLRRAGKKAGRTRRTS